MRVFEQGSDRDEDIVAALTAGRPADESAVEAAVREIIEDVRIHGDQALLELGRTYDSGRLTDLTVSDRDLSTALSSLDSSVRASMERAVEHVQSFHQQEKQSSWFSTRDGSTFGQIVHPLDSVGIYVPGGRASYPSTVIMTAIPAAVAGVGSICLATPAAQDGNIPGVVLAACKLCGVERVFKMGGAQAIAALAYGTASVPRVDKIVGPGNQYVNAAKRLLFGQVGIDSLAGPSEVLIIADGSVRPEWIAADLIAQAEHGGESKALLITWSRVLADKVLACVSELAAQQPRESYIRQALASRGAVVLATNEDEALRLANTCAPEHLQLLVRDPQEWVGRIHNAGAIFVGPYSPVPLGDYIAGPSHTLPTGASARFSSALGVAEFQKRTSLIWYGQQEYAEDARAAMILAQAEGLHAHEAALAVRFNED